MEKYAVKSTERTMVVIKADLFTLTFVLLYKGNGYSTLNKTQCTLLPQQMAVVETGQCLPVPQQMRLEAAAPCCRQ